MGGFENNVLDLFYEIGYNYLLPGLMKLYWICFMKLDTIICCLV